jgi:hypothetical protein
MALEGTMKHLLAGLAIIAAISAAGSALAADLLLRAVAPSYAAHWSAHGPRELGTRNRPRSAEAFASTDRGAVVAATDLKARDSHVLEFLRWKEQLGTASSRVVELSR